MVSNSSTKAEATAISDGRRGELRRNRAHGSLGNGGTHKHQDLANRTHSVCRLLWIPEVIDGQATAEVFAIASFLNDWYTNEPRYHPSRNLYGVSPVV